MKICYYTWASGVAWTRDLCNMFAFIIPDLSEVALIVCSSTELQKLARLMC